MQQDMLSTDVIAIEQGLLKWLVCMTHARSLIHNSKAAFKLKTNRYAFRNAHSFAIADSPPASELRRAEAGVHGQHIRDEPT